MKRTFRYLLLAVLPLALSACGDDDLPVPDGQKPEKPKVDAGIAVTINDEGKPTGKQEFTLINEYTFQIDDIIYKADKGELTIEGYNKAFFKGEAKVISLLNYQGRELPVTGIAEEAFKDCTVLTSIKIPSSVKHIGSYAFTKCKALESVTLSEGQTDIGRYAFQFCTGLTSIAIPESVTYIGRYAFNNCDNLRDIYCYAVEPPGSESNIDGYAATLHVPAESVKAYRTTPPWSDFKNIVAL